jgi:hypothetical protein
MNRYFSLFLVIFWIFNLLLQNAEVSSKYEQQQKTDGSFYFSFATRIYHKRNFALEIGANACLQTCCGGSSPLTHCLPETNRCRTCIRRPLRLSIGTGRYEHLAVPLSFPPLCPRPFSWSCCHALVRKGICQECMLNAWLLAILAVIVFPPLAFCCVLRWFSRFSLEIGQSVAGRDC